MKQMRFNTQKTVLYSYGCKIAKNKQCLWRVYIDLIYKAVKDLVITEFYQRLEKAIVWR